MNRCDTGKRCTVTDLRCKEVINICDGTRLGFVSDVHIDLCTGRVVALAVPGRRSLRALFGKDGDCVIPWSAIRNIGDDIILVEDSACIIPEKHRRWRSDDDRKQDNCCNIMLNLV